MTTSYENFRRTLPRLLGMFNLSGMRAAKLLDISSQHMSFLMRGARNPTLKRLRDIGSLFDIDPIRLVDCPFEELLQNELSDPKRYRETEERIKILEAEQSAKAGNE